MGRSSTTLGRVPGVGHSKLQSVTCALLVAAGMALAVAGCGGGDDEGAGRGTTSGTASLEVGECADVEAPAPRDGGGESAPAEPLDPSQTWTLTFDTSCGTFVVTLDLESAPQTAASLAALAENGYFDDTVFHRIVPGFVIQAGDPTGTGGGGPGYTTEDTPADTTAYPEGTVAMAKTATEPPGTAGSQFFVVTADDAGLPPDYAVIGTVTEGQDVVDRIGILGDPNTELPTQPVVIEDIEIEAV